MSKKRRRHRRSKVPPPGSVPVHTPSPDEVERMKSGPNAWTSYTLATWGVGWPPPKGWRESLRRKWQMERRWNRENDAEGDVDELTRRWLEAMHGEN